MPAWFALRVFFWRSQLKDLRQIDQLPDSALVSVQVFAALTGQSVSTVWRKFNNEPGYPTPVRLGTRCTRVKLGDVRGYIAGCVADEMEVA